jgi:hypothetical protein
MALVQGTNSYVSYSDAEDYFDTRIDAGAWLNADTDDQESALITATAILDDYHYIGVAVSSTQSLAWPRKDAVYFERKLGTQVTLSQSAIPTRLKLATYELALHLLTNENLLDNTTQTFERIKVGSIEIEDSNKDVSKTPMVPLRVKQRINPLLASGGDRSWWRAN